MGLRTPLRCFFVLCRAYTTWWVYVVSSYRIVVEAIGHVEPIVVRGERDLGQVLGRCFDLRLAFLRHVVLPYLYIRGETSIWKNKTVINL